MSNKVLSVCYDWFDVLDWRIVCIGAVIVNSVFLLNRMMAFFLRFLLIVVTVNVVGCKDQYGPEKPLSELEFFALHFPEVNIPFKVSLDSQLITTGLTLLDTCRLQKFHIFDTLAGLELPVEKKSPIYALARIPLSKGVISLVFYQHAPEKNQQHVFLVNFLNDNSTLSHRSLAYSYNGAAKNFQLSCEIEKDQINFIEEELDLDSEVGIDVLVKTFSLGWTGRLQFEPVISLPLDYIGWTQVKEVSNQWRKVIHCVPAAIKEFQIHKFNHRLFLSVELASESIDYRVVAFKRSGHDIFIEYVGFDEAESTAHEVGLIDQGDGVVKVETGEDFIYKDLYFVEKVGSERLMNLQAGPCSKS